MTLRIVKLGGFYFDWPIGAVCPLSTAMDEGIFSAYYLKHGPDIRVANNNEKLAVLASNRSGAELTKLTEAEIIQRYSAPSEANAT